MRKKADDQDLGTTATVEAAPVTRGPFAKKAAVGFMLPNKKVSIRLYKRPTALIPDTNHVASGLVDNASLKLVVPMTREGRFKDPLTQEEREFLENSPMTDFNPGELNVHNRIGNNYWEKYHIILPKEGLHLDLSNPMDYLKYKVALVNTGFVAPSFEDRDKKMSYKFYIEDTEKMADVEANLVNREASAYEYIGQIKENRPMMMNLLRLLGKVVNPEHSDNYLIAELRNVIRDNNGGLEKFLRLTKDPDLNTKITLLKAHSCGYLVLRGGRYQVKTTGLVLGTLEEAVVFVKSPDNEDVYMSVTSYVNTHYKG
jgi:hypothetical protein